MAHNRLEYEEYRRIAIEHGLDPSDVRRMVQSFFRVVRDSASVLPLNNARRIFKKEKFDSLIKVFNIPYIGRIGPVYSRYLAWRRNIAQEQFQESRSSFRSRRTQSDIENMAADVLAGRTPVIPERKKKSELFYSVWVVDKNGKRLAKQVIKK